MDIKKISEAVKIVSEQNLTPYEMSALGKMISGAAESMIYKEIVDEAKTKSDYSMIGSDKLN